MIVSYKKWCIVDQKEAWCLNSFLLKLDCKMWLFFISNIYVNSINMFGKMLHACVHICIYTLLQLRFKESLWKQILTLSRMLSCCKEKMNESNLFFIIKEEINMKRNIISKQFEETVPVSGTRCFHQLDCTGGTKLAANARNSFCNMMFKAKEIWYCLTL